MKNKLGSMLLLLVLTMALCGCTRIEDTFTILSDNTIVETYTIAYEKSATDKAISEAGLSSSSSEIMDLPVQKIDGVDYYIEKETKSYTQTQFSAEYPEVIANKNKFYAYFENTYADLSAQEKQEITEMKAYIDFISYGVTLPSPIVKTNGKLDGDKTAIWTYTLDDLTKTMEMYAYTANDSGDISADKTAVTRQIKAAEDAAKKANKTKKDKKAPVIKGVKKNKAYKKKATVYVKDNVKLKKVTVNGKKVKLKKVKSGKYKGYYKFTVKKKGKNKIVAVDTSGNKKTMTIKIKK